MCAPVQKLTAASRSLIYPRYLPEGARTEVPTPDDFHIKKWERVKLFTKDGETLNSYFVKALHPAGVTVRLPLLCGAVQADPV